MTTLEQLKRLSEEELRMRLCNQFHLTDDEIDVLYPTTDQMAQGYFERMQLLQKPSTARDEDAFGYSEGEDDYVPEGKNAAVAETLVKEKDTADLRKSILETKADVSVEEVEAAMAALKPAKKSPSKKKKAKKS
jgi:hypothetical protein